MISLCLLSCITKTDLENTYSLRVKIVRPDCSHYLRSKNSTIFSSSSSMFTTFKCGPSFPSWTSPSHLFLGLCFQILIFHLLISVWAQSHRLFCGRPLSRFLLRLLLVLCLLLFHCLFYYHDQSNANDFFWQIKVCLRLQKLH